MISILVAIICGVLGGLYFVAGVGVALACLIGLGFFALALLGVDILMEGDF